MAPTATDNSGTLQYVRVEFAGFAPSLNNEFNGFTFAAIGSGTRMSYLQTMAPLDDSYEFFGGGFDIDHLVAFETADDILDMSEGFVGRIQYVIGYNSVQLTPRTGAGFYATDLEGIENDGCNGSGCDNGFNQQPYTIPLVANVTLIGCGDATCVGSGGGFGMMLRRGTGGYYINSVFARFPSAGISLRDAETFGRARECRDSRSRHVGPHRSQRLLRRNAGALPGEHGDARDTVLARRCGQLAHAQHRRGGSALRLDPREGLGPDRHRGLRLHAGSRFGDRDGRPECLYRKDSDEGRNVRDADAVHGRRRSGRNEVVAGLDRLLPRLALRCS